MSQLKPLYSALDKCLLQQGLQMLINQCDEHLAALQKGQQVTEQDPTQLALKTIYLNRKEQCSNLIPKLSLLNTPSPVNQMPGA